MIIAVDFDGVLTPNGHWPDAGEPNTKLFEWLKFYKELGGKLILWTNRTGAALENAVAFCKEQGLEFDTVNKNLPEITAHFKDDGPKVTADLYIDDKAARVEFRGGEKLMNEQENKVIDKIEKLLALAGSDNENEARAAMVKAQELMAKYEIDRKRVQGKEHEERPVIYLSSGPFKDEWINMVATVIAENFRCRCITASITRTGGSFRIRFYGYEEDAEICINIFNYAVKVVRKRFVTLRAIYAEAGRDFRRNEKMNYIAGFCQGLDRNFEEQKKQSQSFALALVTPEAVDRYVNELPGVVLNETFKYERNRENALLRRTGYVDGKTFQNAGDKEKLTGI